MRTSFTSSFKQSFNVSKRSLFSLASFSILALAFSRPSVLNSRLPIVSLSKYLTHKQQIHNLQEKITYQQLYHYLDIHHSKNNFLMIQPSYFSYHDLYLIKEIIQKQDFKIIIIDSNSISLDILKQFILFLYQAGISIYDVIPKSDEEIINYINNYNTSEYYILNNNKTISKQKVKSR